MEVKEMDLLGAGREQIVLESGDLRAAIAPEKGGRIVELSYGGVNAYHRLYPNGFAFGPYTEYGGLEEHVGSAPGSVWNVAWETERQNGSVILSAYSNKTLVRKKISLADDAPLLWIEYELSNYSTNLARFTFGLHPEISLGGDHRAIRYHIPLEGKVESGDYGGAGFRKYVIPDQGWSAATADGKLFLQMLHPDVTDCLEIYYPRVDTHLVLQPVIFGVGLTPDMTARFRYLVYYGPGDERSVEEIYARYTPDLTKEYVRAEPPPANLQPPRREAQNRGGDFGFDGAIEKAMREGEKAVRNVRRNIPMPGQAPRPPEPVVNVNVDVPIPVVHSIHATPPEPPHAGHAPDRGRDRNQERLIILQGVAEGRYSVEDALRLLEKL